MSLFGKRSPSLIYNLKWGAKLGVIVVVLVAFFFWWLGWQYDGVS